MKVKVESGGRRKRMIKESGEKAELRVRAANLGESGKRTPAAECVEKATETFTNANVASPRVSGAW